MPALSNEGELSFEELPATAARPALTKHQFKATPPMATYLVGVVVGELASVEGVYTRPADTGPPVPVRVWGRVGNEGALQFALDVAIAALNGALL